MRTIIYDVHKISSRRQCTSDLQNIIYRIQKCTTRMVWKTMFSKYNFISQQHLQDAGNEADNSVQIQLRQRNIYIFLIRNASTQMAYMYIKISELNLNRVHLVIMDSRL